MARASYIWIVQTSDDHILAAFTVKHECVRWLASQVTEIDDWKVLRTPDGRNFEHRDIPIYSADDFINL